jgi:hypothetical protein
VKAMCRQGFSRGWVAIRHGDSTLYSFATPVIQVPGEQGRT